MSPKSVPVDSPHCILKQSAHTKTTKNSAAVHHRVPSAHGEGIQAGFLPCFSSLISARSKNITLLAAFDQEATRALATSGNEFHAQCSGIFAPLLLLCQRFQLLLPPGTQQKQAIASQYQVENDAAAHKP